jgi:hypothetical protein
VPVLLQVNGKFIYVIAYYNGTLWMFSQESGIPAKTINSRIVCWYEEVFVECIFPDEDAGYLAAKNASNDNIRGTGLHQEGQAYAKNHFIRNLMQ